MEWISVKDKLPEENELILLMLISRNGQSMYDEIGMEIAVGRLVKESCQIIEELYIDTGEPYGHGKQKDYLGNFKFRVDTPLFRYGFNYIHVYKWAHLNLPNKIDDMVLLVDDDGECNYVGHDHNIISK